MATRDPDDTKRALLARAGTLHPHPEKVTDALFAQNPFFDPLDGLQAKYEMLRRVRVDGDTISRAAAAFGLSRPSYYQAREAFDRDGLLGLLPEKKGPKRAHKLTPEVVDFLRKQLEAEPELGPGELARRLDEQLDVVVHPKSIRRALDRSKKNPAARRGPRP